MTNESVQPVTKGDLAGLEERLGDRLKGKASIGDLDALGQRLEKNIGERLEKSIVGKLEKSIGNRIDSAVDTLARITKDGFDAVDKRFDVVEERLDGVDRQLGVLDRGQDDIKLRLHELAHNFEVVDLTRRVQRIEHKVGISSV